MCSHSNNAALVAPALGELFTRRRHPEEPFEIPVMNVAVLTIGQQDMITLPVHTSPVSMDVASKIQ